MLIHQEIRIHAPVIVVSCNKPMFVSLVQLCRCNTCSQIGETEGIIQISIGADIFSGK